MNFLRAFYRNALLAALLPVSLLPCTAQTPAHKSQDSAKPAQKVGAATVKSYPPALVKNGAALFRQDCSFCHGRDAGGGESGPDLTRSKLVAQDVAGDRIGPVV